MQSFVFSLPHREMWDYLDHIATFLSNMGKVLRTMPSSEKSLVRQGLSSATRRYTASQRARKRTRTPRTQSKAIPFITGDNGQLLPGGSRNTPHTLQLTPILIMWHVHNYRGPPLLQWWASPTSHGLLQGLLQATERWWKERKAIWCVC